MKHWTRESLIRSAGQHLYSEAEARLQILRVDSEERCVWELPFGILVATILEGECTLTTSESTVSLKVNDQIILQKGERFSFRAQNANAPCVVQCLWVPGISGRN